MCTWNDHTSYVIEKYFDLLLIAVQIDFSKELVAWVRKEGYALLDANLYPKPSTSIQLVSGVYTYCILALINSSDINLSKTLAEIL